MTDVFSLPSYQRPEYGKVLPDLELMSDLLGGTRAMHDKSGKYIEKWTAESTQVYDIRRKCENLFEGVSRTLSAATGLLFAKPPKLEWGSVEETMAEDWGNIDGAGTAGIVFAKRFTNFALRDGLSAILVDHTPAPAGVVVTAANEKSLGLRPHWALYQRSQIFSWRTGVIDGRTVLTQVVLQEQAELPTGSFGVEARTQFRILQMVNGVATWRLLRQRRDKISAYQMGDYELVGSGYYRNRTGQPKDHLPFYPGYTGDTVAPLQATIPLLGVAWANLAHWQQSTDLRFYRRLAAYPQPTVIGSLAEELGADGQVHAGTVKVGPMVVIHLLEGGEFKWTEIEGKSMDQLEKGIEEKAQQMAQQGMSFLTKTTRAAETAEAKRLDATAENSTISTAAQGIEDALNSALACHAWYYGVEDVGAPTISINRDFESTVMDAQTMAVYIQAVVQAGVPARLLLEAWKAGGVLPPDTDVEELEREMMVNQAVIAAEKQAQLDAQTNDKNNNDPGVDIEYDATGKKPVGLKKRKTQPKAKP